MGFLRMFGEAFGVFAVSVVVLFVFYMIMEKRATGIGMAHVKGYVLMCVGVLYIVLGVVLTRLK